jgi:hypothetical protein
VFLETVDAAGANMSTKVTFHLTLVGWILGSQYLPYFQPTSLELPINTIGTSGTDPSAPGSSSITVPTEKDCKSILALAAHTQTTGSSIANQHKLNLISNQYKYI